ncbi:MAG: peroxiredoxin [Minicystis sp.]
MLKVGDPAPRIDAIASNGSRFVLDEQPGLCTVIYFFPKAFTPGCTAETKDFRKNYMELDLAGASVVGISTDEPQTQCRFADALGVPFPIIGDEDRAISRAYDVLWPLVGLAQRVTYVVGPRPDGAPGRIVEAVFHHELRVSAHRDDVLRFVDAKFRTSRPPQ